MNRRRLAPVFLVVSIALLVIDYFLPAADGLGLLGQLAEWGLFGVSLVLLVLAVAFRGRGY